MTISNPGESADYRAARDRLLADEIALRERLEAVAAARRALPPGGLVPEDYVFDGLGADGRPAKVRLSELFAPGKDALVVYCYMFPRHHDARGPGPRTGRPRSCRWSRARAHRARPSWTASTAPPRTSRQAAPTS